MTPFTCAKCGAEIRGFTHKCAPPRCEKCGSKLICPICKKKEKIKFGNEVTYQSCPHHARGHQCHFAAWWECGGFNCKVHITFDRGRKVKYV